MCSHLSYTPYVSYSVGGQQIKAFTGSPKWLFEASNRARISMSILKMGKMRFREVHECLSVQGNFRPRSKTKILCDLSQLFHLHPLWSPSA